MIFIGAAALTMPAIGQHTMSMHFGQPYIVNRGTCRNTILDNVNSIVFIWDNQTRLTYMNPFGLKYFGFTRDELIGKSIVGTFVPKTSTSGKDLEHMIKDIVAHPENYVSNQNQNVKKNGERVEILWSNTAIKDKNGNVLEIISVGNVMKG